MDHFTPLPAVAGAIFIGLASVWMLAAWRLGLATQPRLMGSVCL
jgi:hypothetical protein